MGPGRRGDALSPLSLGQDWVPALNHCVAKGWATLIIPLGPKHGTGEGGLSPENGGEGLPKREAGPQMTNMHYTHSSRDSSDLCLQDATLVHGSEQEGHPEPADLGGLPPASPPLEQSPSLGPMKTEPRSGSPPRPLPRAHAQEVPRCRHICTQRQVALPSLESPVKLTCKAGLLTGKATLPL